MSEEYCQKCFKNVKKEMAFKKVLFLHYSLQVSVLLWWQETCGIFLFELFDLGIERFPLLATGLQITTQV